ncbi:hypothetical protein GBA52_026242 [Prunus armeniaca]|nr:hypothetical protein GBA52_026242 [Prunus armeniaca]
MWAAQFYKYRRPRQWLTSGIRGYGFGLPAAIGAAVANPDAIVADIDGDGSFCIDECPRIGNYQGRESSWLR